MTEPSLNISTSDIDHFLAVGEKLPAPAADLEEIAAVYGTPTYVYAEDVVRKQCRALQEAFSSLPVRFLYAMKANNNPALLRVIQQEGLGLDVVSPGELALARGVGFSSDEILFSANNMTDEEMHTAYDSGALLNIGELSRLERFGAAYPGSAVCVRINPHVGGGHHEHVVTASGRSKFGVPVHQLDEVLRVARQYQLEIVGLHQHIGSGITDSGLIWEAMQVLKEAALQVESLQFLNFGGGFGIPYEPGETALNVDRLRELIQDPLLQFAKSHPSDDLTFWFEPGRYIVAQSGVLLIQVNTLKEANGRVFAGCNSGMGHLLRPAVYRAYHDVCNVSNPSGALHRYDVAGNICEAGDVFAEQRLVQEVREGDVLAVLDAGAYGMTMSSDYNLRPRPSEVVIDTSGDARLVRRRRTPDELAEQLLQEANVTMTGPVTSDSPS